MEFECTFEEFKKLAKEFRESANTMNLEELDNAWKCLSLHYLGMKEEHWRHSASIVLQLETRTYVAREIQLL